LEREQSVGSAPVLLFGVFRRGNKPPVLPEEEKKL